jgi:hypothetical protein
MKQRAANTYLSPFCRSPTEFGLLKLWRMQSIVPMPVVAKFAERLLFASFIAWWLTHVDRYV